MPARIILTMLIILAAMRCPASDTDSPCAPTPITIVTPSHGACIQSDTVILLGTVAPDARIHQVTINGIPIPVRRGIFSAVVPLPVPGNNIITVTARTPAGTTFTAGTVVDHVPFDSLPDAADDLILPLLDQPDPPLDEPDEPQYDGRTLAAM